MTGNSNAPRNVIFNADCIDVMDSFDTGSADLILTDPPYVTRYKSRDGKTVINDDNDRWLGPAFNQMHGVLKDGGFCISFYGWNKIDLFFRAWKAAGFRVVGHIVFRKGYASSKRFLRYEHEQAYLLAKGNPTLPERERSRAADTCRARQVSRRAAASAIQSALSKSAARNQQVPSASSG
jgi:site-specific DNA-methyltransferase (adenine-specific)